MNRSTRKEQGVTLIELMIGLLLGLIVVGMVSTMYISTIGILGQTSSTIRLNGELRAVNELITRSVKRAGYWNSDDVASNPHASVVAGGMQIGLFKSPDWTNPTVSGADCIVVSYDANNDGATSPIEVFGVRINGSVIQVTSTASVSAGDTATCDSLVWDPLTESSFSSMSSLSINYVPALGSVASVAELTAKGIEFQLSGSVVDDPAITQTVSGAVQLRNSSFW